MIENCMIPLMQTAAYAKAYDKMFSEQVEALVILYFNINTHEVQVIREQISMNTLPCF